MNPISYNRVYYVEGPAGTNKNPFAIRPKIFQNRIECEDGGWRGTVFRLGKIDEQQPDVIEFTTKDGVHYKLVLLTLDIYNREKYRLANPRNFASDVEMQNYYLKQDFENS